MGLMGSAREAEGLRLYAAANGRFAKLQTTMAGERTNRSDPSEKAEGEGRAMGWEKALACALERTAGKQEYRS